MFDNEISRTCIEVTAEADDVDARVIVVESDGRETTIEPMLLMTISHFVIQYVRRKRMRNYERLTDPSRECQKPECWVLDKLANGIALGHPQYHLERLLRV